MRIATIDIGTNTILLLVCEVTESGLVPVEEHATITRLGEGVDKTRALAPQAIERALQCIGAYKAIIDRLGATRIAVVGTSAMRDAEGGEAFQRAIENRLGAKPRVISGEEEARLTFKGAVSGLPIEEGRPVAVFDIGGGSTEIVSGTRSPFSLAYAHSANIGSVRLTERHVTTDPPSPQNLLAIAADAKTALDSIPPLELDPTSPLIGIAGTVTTYAAVALGLQTYDANRVHGRVMRRATLETEVLRLASLRLENRRQVHGLEPKRADVIVAGGLIALALLDRLQKTSFIVSDRGVRWGLAEELAELHRT